jgi:hypothetical protein
VQLVQLAHKDHWVHKDNQVLQDRDQLVPLVRQVLLDYKAHQVVLQVLEAVQVQLVPQVQLVQLVYKVVQDQLVLLVMQVQLVQLDLLV